MDNNLLLFGLVGSMSWRGEYGLRIQRIAWTEMGQYHDGNMIVMMGWGMGEQSRWEEGLNVP